MSDLRAQFMQTLDKQNLFYELDEDGAVFLTLTDTMLKTSLTFMACFDLPGFPVRNMAQLTLLPMTVPEDARARAITVCNRRNGEQSMIRYLVSATNHVHLQINTQLDPQNAGETLWRLLCIMLGEWMDSKKEFEHLTALC